VNATPRPRRPVPLFLLWLVVLIEFLSPIPAFLTFGAVWVLLFRPPWFLELVQGLYGGSDGPGGNAAAD